MTAGANKLDPFTVKFGIGQMVKFLSARNIARIVDHVGLSAFWLRLSDYLHRDFVLWETFDLAPDETGIFDEIEFVTPPADPRNLFSLLRLAQTDQDQRCA